MARELETAAGKKTGIAGRGSVRLEQQARLAAELGLPRFAIRLLGVRGARKLAAAGG